MPPHYPVRVVRHLEFQKVYEVYVSTMPLKCQEILVFQEAGGVGDGMQTTKRAGTYSETRITVFTLPRTLKSPTTSRRRGARLSFNASKIMFVEAS